MNRVKEFLFKAFAAKGDGFSPVFQNILDGKQTVEAELQRGHGSFHTALLNGDIMGALRYGSQDNMVLVVQAVSEFIGHGAVESGKAYEIGQAAVDSGEVITLIRLILSASSVED